MTDLEDFGGEAPAIATSPPDNLIQFPQMRPSEKLSDAWSKELERRNARLQRSYRFISPLQAAADLERQRKLATMPWPSAWPELSKRCRTYVGQCVGVVGPTGGGKTSFAIQVGRAATAEGIPVLWNPLELDPAEVDLRLVANMTAIHTARIRDDWTQRQIESSLAAIDDLWRYIPRERTVEASLEAYRVAIDMAKTIYGRPPLLVIDYIGKLARGTRDPRLATADAAESLRELAVAMECYILILAQPSRSNNATLTGKSEIENASDAVGVAGESAEIEHACANVIGLNVFKLDDTDELDAHCLVSKARNTGREGREGYRFSKPGGVWRELDRVPPTPGEVSAKLKSEKKNKSRIEPATKEIVRRELDVEAGDDANAERRRRVLGALRRAGMQGTTFRSLLGVPGTGRTGTLQATLQELERAGDVEKLTGTNVWRLVPR